MSYVFKLPSDETVEQQDFLFHISIEVPTTIVDVDGERTEYRKWPIAPMYQDQAVVFLSDVPQGWIVKVVREDDPYTPFFLVEGTLSDVPF